MPSKIKAALFPKNSILTKLNLSGSAVVMTAVFVGIGLFSYLTVVVQKSERAESLSSFASMTARMVARPLSTGDFILVEDYLNGVKLPDYVRSVAVLDRAGKEIAARSMSQALLGKHSCTNLATFRSSIIDASILATTSQGPEENLLEISASNCDIEETAKSLGLTATILGLVLFALLTIANRLSIGWALRPLKKTVSLNLSRENMDSDVIKTCPAELEPMLRQIQGLYAQIIEAEAKSKVGELATQVAHDIRSPLAALDSMIKEIGSLPEDQRAVFSNAISRIKDIANQLIVKTRELLPDEQESGAIEDGPRATSVQLLSSLVDPIVSEKRSQYRSRLGVVIETKLSTECYGLFAAVSPLEFKRVLSNLIDNAVESISDDGRVEVSFHKNEGSLQIRIADTGQGIDPKVIPELMQRGRTFGKKNGSGLGLYHAKTSIDEWGGLLSLQSELGLGTCVTISLPLATPPEWYVEKLSLSQTTDVVILDDDSSIHQVWKSRFESAQGLELRLHHFSKPEELRDFVHDLSGENHNTLYLIDFELIGHEETGLDLISELKIASSSILVTSRFEEPKILNRCKTLGVKLIPKGMAGFILVEANACAALDAILIDDDSLTRQSWTATARLYGKQILTFEAPPSLERLSGVDKSTPIYIDSDLGRGQKGELIAKAYFDSGFKEIYLATGHFQSHFKPMSWIKCIVDKRTPWAPHTNHRASLALKPL